MILTDFTEKSGMTGWSQKAWKKAKKSGPVAVTLNLRSQPRLPGSVVGEASMRLELGSDKIT
jgi:hypothetical protein